MNRGALLGVGLLVGFAVVAAFLVNSTQKSGSPAATSAPAAQTQMPQNQGASAPSGQAAREVTVSGNEYNFMPSSLNLKKGETVKIVFKNTGALPHDLVVDEIGLKTKVIKGGETDTITFTPDKTGTFEMYCSVGNHRAQGMKGPAIVE